MSVEAEDLTGRRYGRYTVIGRAESYISKSGTYQTRWLCRCDCGNERIVFAQALKSGHSKSCGCLQKETATKHGQKYTRLYGIWHNMKWRCSNEHCQSYPNYGGRGISVCAEWERFEPFMEWAMRNGYTDKLTLDRIDNDGDYCPNNCRWATAKEQANNRRNNHYITAFGETRTVSEWAKISGISRQAINWRINNGWMPEDAITIQGRDCRGRC